MRRLLIPVLAVALLTASCTRPPEDAPAAPLPGTIDLHDQSGTLPAYGLQPAELVAIVERANAFHEGIWPARAARFGHRVYLMKQWSAAADDLAAATPGCVTVLALENIQRLANRHRRPLVEAVELAVAHGQFHPAGGVILDRDVRPYAEAAAPSLPLQDLTSEAGDFTFAITRTAIDDESSKARIRFFAVCPAWTECEVGD